ncbi:MAG TPA: hypothetical protein VNM69_10735 [Bacillus sp. (in: firmicutes)]|uniref:hypothetical protein n=1 Tax=Bacillus litorisediminis TaxID=2922713 RepID=UPI001FAE1D5F|nr:hypothetical protein [Bacillus litorisediminis]HWO76356.1 hypothetical protein [Bacillus sp. (in: firmicutes)]
MIAISSEEVIHQLLEIEKELIELEALFAESYEQREREFMELTNKRVQKAEGDLQAAQEQFQQIKEESSNFFPIRKRVG